MLARGSWLTGLAQVAAELVVPLVGQERLDRGACPVLVADDDILEAQFGTWTVAPGSQLKDGPAGAWALAVG